ncbi:MAG: glycine--tRNA ligase subunit alpha [Thermotoga sp.]|nr:MAG: glycine--tRNA ligase subunit alpha [Thermotoga sp.]
MYLQEIVKRLNEFWANYGCLLAQPYDMRMGAGTFHPFTFFRVLGLEPWEVAYVQISRRPVDGRYGENPNRLQQFYQYQTVLKPSPLNVQQLYIDSLTAISLNPKEHDIRFIEDNWRSPTLGAWGIGWEVWLDGMEITQFTYFQQVGGIDLKPISVEITYGIERIAMYLQNVEDVYDIQWSKGISYGELFKENEKEQSYYNFEYADVSTLLNIFEEYTTEFNRLYDKKLLFPAYECIVNLSHIFNILDARNALSVMERQNYIDRIRMLSSKCAKVWLQKRKELGFPLLSKSSLSRISNT